MTHGHWIAAMSLGTLFALNAPVVARAEGTPVNASERTEVTPTSPPPAADSPEDASRRQLRYAQREAKTPQTAAFKGQGVGIYIGGSTLAVVLAVVLIVVLL